MTVPEVLPPRRLAAGEKPPWDDSADTVVVGFGAAGACAAIESAERGADVLVLDRMVGGGDTAFSGGAVYAGGGTRAQLSAGFSDSADNMYRYLRLEVAGAVDDATLHRFCDGSLDDMRWLESHGLKFGTRFWPDKTPFPPDGYYLSTPVASSSLRSARPPILSHAPTRPLLAGWPRERSSSHLLPARRSVLECASVGRHRHGVWFSTLKVE